MYATPRATQPDPFFLTSYLSLLTRIIRKKRVR